MEEAVPDAAPVMRTTAPSNSGVLGWSASETWFIAESISSTKVMANLVAWNMFVFSLGCREVNHVLSSSVDISKSWSFSPNRPSG